MSKVTNKDIAKCFKRAKVTLATDIRDHIINYKTPYICHAIDDIYGMGSSIKDDCKRIIQLRLGKHLSLERWLIGNKVVNSVPSLDEMQPYRHRWLDSLIEEFNSKAD